MATAAALTFRRAALAGCLVALTCGREERTQAAFTPALERSSVTGDSTALLAAVTPSLPDTTVADTAHAYAAGAGVALEGIGSAAIAGSVTAARAGTGTRLTARLTGGSPRTTYAGTIRSGTCAAIGSRVASLVPVTTDSLGDGASVSDISSPLRALLSAPHVIVFGKHNRPETCGGFR